jgi:hypothetical protein
MISRREVAHAIDVPLLSGAVVVLREAMPTSLAHSLEPLTAVMGASLLSVPAGRWLRARLALPRQLPTRGYVTTTA